MQGTAADLIKRAMLRVDRWLADAGAPGRMILQVHDELVREVPLAQIDATITAVRNCMIEVATRSLPLVVDIGVGDNAGEAH